MPEFGRLLIHVERFLFVFVLECVSCLVAWQNMTAGKEEVKALESQRPGPDLTDEVKQVMRINPL